MSLLIIRILFRAFHQRFCSLNEIQWYIEIHPCPATILYKFICNYSSAEGMSKWLMDFRWTHITSKVVTLLFYAAIDVFSLTLFLLLSTVLVFFQITNPTGFTNWKSQHTTVNQFLSSYRLIIRQYWIFIDATTFLISMGEILMSYFKLS